MNGLWIVVSVLLVIGAICGFAKGAIKILVSLAATLLTIAVVFFAAPMVSKGIYLLTPIDDAIEQQLREKLMNRQEEITEGEDEQELPRNKQITVIEESELPDAFKELLVSNNNKEVYELLGVTKFVDYFISYLTKLMIDILAYILTFVIVTIVVRILIIALDFVADLPVLGILNRFSGMAVGILLALIGIWFLFLFITLIYGTAFGKSLMEMIEQEKMLRILYEMNPIMKMLTMLR